jgi:hypothetical protein
MEEARPVLPTRIGEERELRDNQEGRLDLDGAEVELSRLIAEDPQLQNLVRQVIGVALRVGVGHPKQDAIAGTD